MPSSQLPAKVADFIFDLADSCRRTQTTDEQKQLYTTTFNELSATYYSQSPWPSADEDDVKNECRSDPLFLALYSELTSRHTHNSLPTRPSLAQKLETWSIYRKLFDLVLQCQDNAHTGSLGNQIMILPEWAFEIMHEFVYQFQGFCQFRTQVFSRILTPGSSDNGTLPNNHEEDLQLLKDNKDAWAIETVMFYLHNLIRVSNVKNDASMKSSPGQIHGVLGYFSCISLSRLECLIGDYYSSIEALDHVNMFSRNELFAPLFAPKLSVFYHSGIALFNLRRFKDCSKLYQSILLQLSRGFRTGLLGKLPGSEQFQKLNEKMLSLLAITHHLNPSLKLEEALSSLIATKFGDKLSKIEAGEDGYEGLYEFACPKFVSPVVPDYTLPTGVNSSQEAYRQQVKITISEISQIALLPKLRSYLKLYTSIGVGKLGGFNSVGEEEELSRLLCFKYKSMQVEGWGKATSSLTENNENYESETSAVVAKKTGTSVGSVCDVQYYIDETLTIRCEREERNFTYDRSFVNGCKELEELNRELEKIQETV